MKLHCFLVSFAVVQVIAPMRFDEYKRAVFHANRHLERATVTNVGLKPVITSIILGNSTMEDIALLLAVPELANARFLLGDKCDQEFLKLTVVQSTNQPPPTAHITETFEEQALPYLGLDRRFMTREVIDDFLRADKLLPTLGTVRRFLMKTPTIELLFAVLLGQAPEFDHMAKICRLIGLYRSIRFPATLTRYAIFNGIDTCEVADDSLFISKYKFVLNSCFELGETIDGGVFLKALLYDQVAEWAAEIYVL